jgi:hypothetical protein
MRCISSHFTLETIGGERWNKRGISGEKRNQEKAFGGKFISVVGDEHIICEKKEEFQQDFPPFHFQYDIMTPGHC